MRPYTAMIRGLREDHNLTQTQVAAWLNIGQQTYADYESGKTRIPLDSIIVLVRKSGVSMDYICGLTSNTGTFPDK